MKKNSFLIVTESYPSEVRDLILEARDHLEKAVSGKYPIGSEEIPIPAFLTEDKIREIFLK